MVDLYVGLMSGTSMDALDAVLVDLAYTPPKLVATYRAALPEPLHEALVNLSAPGEQEIAQLARLDVEVGRLSAHAVNSLLDAAGIAPAAVRAIGSHGQTVRHLPGGSHPTTLQIGDPNIIAEQTGITTVADFRRRDMAAGGQGAPLVPAFHAAVLGSAGMDRVVLNIGGIANLTVLPADKGRSVLGFDIGPGNVLMDGWCARHGRGVYDAQGLWAQSGTVDDALLNALRADEYFRRPPPKSTGREHFNLAWLDRTLRSRGVLAAADVQATLCELTAISVAETIVGYAPASSEVLVCGGGVRNTHLMARLTAHMPKQKVRPTDEAGVPAQWMEAMAFAWLAKQTLEHRPGNLPSVTGAQHAVVLGGIYPGGTKDKR